MVPDRPARDGLHSLRPLPPLPWLPGLHLLLALGCAVAPRRWRWWLGGLLAVHAPLVAGSLLPRSGWLGPNLRRLSPAARARREIALTFDDGPDPVATPRVLALLEAAGARATFFCVGERVEAFPEIAREIVGRGHRVENHTHRHRYLFALLGPRGQAREIDRAQRAIAAICGREPTLFRAPAGFRSPFTHALLRRRGLCLVSWTRRGLDGVDGDASRVYARLVRDLGPGQILLLHDGGRGACGGLAPVLEVLPRLLEEIRRLGLTPVALRSGR